MVAAAAAGGEGMVAYVQPNSAHAQMKLHVLASACTARFSTGHGLVLVLVCSLGIGDPSEQLDRKCKTSQSVNNQRKKLGRTGPNGSNSYKWKPEMCTFRLSRLC